MIFQKLRLLLSEQQFLAAEFTIESDTMVNGVEGWMSFTNDGYGTIAIYSDGGDVPGVELYSTPFLAAGSSFSWRGASGLSWALAANTYWVAFEVRPGQLLLTGMPIPSENPLLNEAFKSVIAGQDWIGDDAINLGIRISAVPVPAAVWLFGSGLIGLIGVARRKKV